MNTPGRIRTCDLSFRKAPLYPTELRGQSGITRATPADGTGRAIPTRRIDRPGSKSAPAATRPAPATTNQRPWPIGACASCGVVAGPSATPGSCRSVAPGRHAAPPSASLMHSAPTKAVPFFGQSATHTEARNKSRAAILPLATILRFPSLRPQRGCLEESRLRCRLSTTAS